MPSQGKHSGLLELQKSYSTFWKPFDQLVPRLVELSMRTLGAAVLLTILAMSGLEIVTPTVTAR